MTSRETPFPHLETVFVHRSGDETAPPPEACPKKQIQPRGKIASPGSFSAHVLWYQVVGVIGLGLQLLHFNKCDSSHRNKQDVPNSVNLALASVHAGLSRENIRALPRRTVGKGDEVRLDVINTSCEFVIPLHRDHGHRIAGQSCLQLLSSLRRYLRAKGKSRCH